MIVDLIEAFYRLLWGDLFTLPVAGGIGISFMVVLLFAAGIGFTLRTRLLPVRLFRDMIGAVCEKKQAAGGLSSFQTLVISTATRVGMGNLVGVVAAVSAGGAGAVFWMWVTALLGASTSFVESTLAQKYRVPDPLYGGWRGGPAYYLHVLAERKRGKKLRRSVCAALFAVSGLICWCGISQVISNSVSSAFENAFHVPPLATTVVLTLLAALIVLRKNATVKSLDFIVPVMAVCYFVITVGIVVLNFRQLPAVLARIFAEAFGLRQVAAGGFGAVLMNGVKRGLRLMEQDGTVVREPDPADRRKTLVRITPKGYELCHQCEQALRNYFASVLARLEPEQVAQMDALRGALMDAILAENAARNINPKGETNHDKDL